MLAFRNWLFPSDNRGVAGLIFLGWRGAIIAILAGLVASFLSAGYWYPYWRLADMDLMMAYQGVLVNSGHPQDFFDHPGHLSIILTSAWFGLFYKLGLVDVLTLAQIPPAADAAAFDRVWTQIVHAGRLLSLTLAGIFTVTFGLLMRRIIREWQIAVLATFCLAFSGGLMMNARTLRTDMIAAGLVTISFLLVLVAARSPRSNMRPLLVGLAAMLVTLGIVNKVHALFLACAMIPVMPLFGMMSDPAQAFWRSQKGMIACVALAVVAAALLAAVSPIVLLGLSTPQNVPPPFGARGFYQAMVVALIAVTVIVHAGIWRVPAVETIATLLAIAGGIALGLLALEVLYHPRNVGIVLNPIEHMFGWAGNSDPKLRESRSVLSLQLLYSFGGGILEVIARRTFVLHSSGRPSIVIDWRSSAISGLPVAPPDDICLITSWALDFPGIITRPAALTTSCSTMAEKV